MEPSTVPRGAKVALHERDRAEPPPADAKPARKRVAKSAPARAPKRDTPSRRRNAKNGS